MASNSTLKSTGRVPKIGVFERLASVLSIVIAVLAGIALIGMLAIVLLDVSGRTLFLNPFQGTLEIVSYVLLPVVVFGGYAIAHHRDQHMRMTLVYDSLKNKAGIWNRVVVETLTLTGIALMVYYAWHRMDRAVAIKEAEVGLVTIPIWPATIFMMIGLSVFLLQSVAILIRDTQLLLAKASSGGNK